MRIHAALATIALVAKREKAKAPAVFVTGPARALRETIGGYGAPKAQWQGADLSALEPEQMEHILADTVLKEFKTRLSRIGLEYQTPARP